MAWGSIPGQGSEIPQELQHSWKKKERKKLKNFSTEWKKIFVSLKMGKRFGYIFLQSRFANG